MSDQTEKAGIALATAGATWIGLLQNVQLILLIIATLVSIAAGVASLVSFFERRREKALQRARESGDG